MYSYKSVEKTITHQDINDIKLQLLQENENVYYTYKNLSSPKQWQLLEAIAIEEKVINITSSKFIQTYQLGAHSTVRLSIRYLVDNELVYTTIDPTTEKLVYHPYDPLLMRWVQSVSYTHLTLPTILLV